MESLLADALETRPVLETFKNNTCHYVKDMGDIDFLISVIKSDRIYDYLEKDWYRE